MRRSAVTAVCLVALLAVGCGSVSSQHVAGDGAHVARAYGRIPQSFAPNRGLADRRYGFLSRGPGYALALRSDSASLALSRHDARAAVRMRLLGARPDAPAAPGARLPGTVNSFHGKDPSRWRTAIPTYGAVAYRSVYPGVDVRYHGDQGSLEYDFTIAPRAHADAIALDFQGARGIALTPAGDLRLRLPGGSLTERAPVAFQGRRRVAARYVVRGGRVGFALGRYDHTRALTIDPVVLAYSTYLGGGGTDQGVGIAVDSAGAAYVTGFTNSPGFPTSSGAYDTSYGNDDAFVSKVNAAGTALVYSTFIGGDSGPSDNGWAIAVDASGAAYITGLSQTTDFPTTPGALDTTQNAGQSSAFVSKLDPTGGTLVYSTYLSGPGTGGSYGTGIAVDSTGAAYVSGTTSQTDFPTTAGAADTTADGQDVFVSKLNPTGSALAYSTYLGGSSSDQTDQTGTSIAIDSTGAAYVTGLTASADFPTTAGAFQTSRSGPSDAFVTKVNPAGTAFAYSTYLGGTDFDNGRAIAVGGDGSAYVTGLTASATFPTTAGAYDQVLSGPGTTQVPYDAFVTKLSPAGTGLTYSTYLGGRSSDSGGDIGVDATGAAYVVGQTSSDDFPNVGGLKSTLEGLDAFVTKVNPAGSALGYSTYLGGPANENAYAVAVAGSGAAYVTGYSDNGGGFPTTPGAFQGNYGGGPEDGFVAKLTDGVQRTLTVTTSGTGTGTVTGPGIDCGGAGHSDCSESVADGATITLTATAASGSSFTTFSGGGCGAANPCTVTMNADKAVDASFAGAPAAPGGPVGGTPPAPGPAPAPGATPTPPTAADLALGCSKRRLVLENVLSRGGHVALSGFADRRFAGRRVAIVFASTGKTVAHATVKADGAFATSAPLPPRRVRGSNGTRYVATLGSERSLSLKLARRMVVESLVARGGSVTIRGHVVAPLPRKATVTVTQRLSCSSFRRVGSTKMQSGGGFTAKVPAPAGQGAAVYRLTTKVPKRAGSAKLSATYTLPIAVDLTPSAP